MKKLIMLAAVTALAFVGRAATVDWKVAYAAKGSVWSANGATVMAFAGSDYADIIKLVTDVGSATLQSDLAGKSLGSSTFIETRGTATMTTAVTTENAPSKMFWMIFTEGSFDGGKSVIWTTATDVSDAYYTPPDSGKTFGLTAESFTGSGTIATASVPEPTSGILLLVGMAGLALRRKRA